MMAVVDVSVRWTTDRSQNSVADAYNWPSVVTEWGRGQIGGPTDSSQQRYCYASSKYGSLSYVHPTVWASI